MEIPIIDCSKISGSYKDLEIEGPGFQEFTQQLGDGLSGLGFVYLVNHSLPPDLVETAFRESRNFFQLPKEVKMKYRKGNAVENFNGYTPPEDEISHIFAKDRKRSLHDFKEAWDSCGPDATWPTEVAGLKGSLDNFRTCLTPLCKKLLFSLGHYLQLEDPELLVGRHLALDDPTILSHNDVRSNYYKLDSMGEFPSDAMHLGEHNDWGTLTFLVQDGVGGLEAQRLSGEWVQVPPISNSIVLNAGVMLEMWTGGHLPATTHRVKLVKSETRKCRQSIGFFVQPDGHATCEPIMEEKKDWSPVFNKIKHETHFEYFKGRIRGSRAYIE